MSFVQPNEKKYSLEKFIIIRLIINYSMVLALKIPLINQMTGNQYLHVKLFEGGIVKKLSRENFLIRKMLNKVLY